jgi:hypothetical protein
MRTIFSNANQDNQQEHDAQARRESGGENCARAQGGSLKGEANC